VAPEYPARPDKDRQAEDDRSRVRQMETEEEDSVDPTITPKIELALRHAARAKRLLPYAQFHAMFDRNTPLSERWQALDAAALALCNAAVADYRVLLACDNGLPGAEFFKRVQMTRRDEYVAIAGDPRFRNATLKQKRLIASMERARVYAHASLDRRRFQAKTIETSLPMSETA
jgi:hypothetical protein